MRIDYSEPKKSYISPQPSSNNSRKESNPLILAVFITGVVSLAIGFGSGWVLSQRYAKKGFQAALQQQSLENSPQQLPTQPAAPKPQAESSQAAAGTQQPQPTGSSVPPGNQPAPEVPLSFYKTLPSAQKNNVLGSGINTADDKSAKQPLQAAIPTNLAKASQQQETAANSTKQPTSASSDKSTASNEANGFTVQVASYSLRSEADALKSKLSNKGYNVHIVESILGDKGTWYRVRVGKKLEQAAAKELASKIGKGAISIPDKN